MILSSPFCFSMFIGFDFKARCLATLSLGNLIPPLFTNLPWKEDRKRIFWRSSQATTCLPHTVEAFTLPFIIERQAGKLRIPIFMVFWFDTGENRTGVHRFSSSIFIRLHWSVDFWLSLPTQYCFTFSTKILVHGSFTISLVLKLEDREVAEQTRRGIPCKIISNLKVPISFLLDCNLEPFIGSFWVGLFFQMFGGLKFRFGNRVFLYFIASFAFACNMLFRLCINIAPVIYLFYGGSFSIKLFLFLVI